MGVQIDVPFKEGDIVWCYFVGEPVKITLNGKDYALCRSGDIIGLADKA